jgi:protein-S-isoprenylcysteine O-methyltransferase Ste14
MKSTLGVAIFTLVATLVYLGVAVLGMGGVVAFFSHPPLIVIGLATLVMSGLALFTEGNLSPGIREDKANRWVIPVLGLIGGLMAYLPAYTDRMGLWTFGGEGVRWLGVVLFIGGGALRMWPVFVLGKRFSGLVAIQPGHTLVTSGIYRKLRNPSYLGLLVNSLGWALAFRSGVGVLLTVLTIVPIIARIRSEEALLRSQFGAQYEAYCAGTWRLVPGLY